jgi:large subunit ribosomal protein L11
MTSEKVSVLIEGGKATAAPPLGPALGPLKINIGQVVSKINEKTSDFKGMKVPVDVIIDTKTKEFKIKVGTPPASQLIKSEIEIKKGSPNPKTEFVGSMSLEQIKKVARMKFDSLLSNDLSGAVREIAGTCYSLGVKVEDIPAKEFIKKVKDGEYKDKLSEEI